MPTDLSQYSGRTVDVLALRGGTTGEEVLLTQSLADASISGEVCTGIQKMAQRFFLRLMTELGTVKYDDTYGTTFMTKLRQGRIHTETDMRSAFALAEQKVRAQMQREEVSTDSLDEQYLSGLLDRLVVGPDWAQLYIQLRSRAEVATFILPIPIVV
jgi:hypothetical protein